MTKSNFMLQSFMVFFKTSVVNFQIVHKQNIAFERKIYFEPIHKSTNSDVKNKPGSEFVFLNEKTSSH